MSRYRACADPPSDERIRVMRRLDRIRRLHIFLAGQSSVGGAMGGWFHWWPLVVLMMACVLVSAQYLWWSGREDIPQTTAELAKERRRNREATDRFLAEEP